MQEKIKEGNDTNYQAIPDRQGQMPGPVMVGYL